MAAPSSYVKTAVMGSLTVLDGTGSPVSLVVPYTRGDLSIGPLGPKLNEPVKIGARGKHLSVAYGARVYPTVSFSAWLPNITGTDAVAPGTLMEFLAGLGAYSANISTSGTGAPMTIDLKWTIEGTNFGDTADETITANDVFCTVTITEAMEGNSVAISGEILGPIVTANSSGTITYAQIS